MKTKTPNTTCINQSKFSNVYPPSEDSFLFLDALELEYNFILDLHPIISLEIGSGSGIISAFFCTFDCKSTIHLCTDISSAACSASLEVLSANVPAKSIAYDIINCSLASPILSRLSHSVDIIFFNPPYVPTSEEEHNSRGSSITASWSGGVMGRQVIDEFLSQAVHLLSNHGCIYLLLSDDNQPDEVHHLVNTLSGGRLMPKLILRRRIHNESLGIYRYA